MLNQVQHDKPLLFGQPLRDGPLKMSSRTHLLIAALHRIYLPTLKSFRKKMKILIVDDSKEMRNMIAEMLKSNLNQIFESEDGDEAVEQYEKIKPDWVLMDIKMKRMNGLEATIKIKQKYPDARIAIVTRYDDKFFRIYAAKVGAEAFISKQNLSDLKKIIN